MATLFTGNAPRNVGRDAKYSVVSGEDEMIVRLYYWLDRHKEVALLTTEGHPRLVAMVNEVKEEQNDRPGGTFYINEFSQVLVPTQNGYFVAGLYDEFLEFSFEGILIGPRAPAGLEPGQEWRGPHVGIPYVLTADGRDVRYEREVRPQVIRRERLRDVIGAGPASQLAQRLARHKAGGGRVYINEAREFFAPIEQSGTWKYIYLGNLRDDSWFPAPTAT